MYERKLLCLANSFKHGGRCIAGQCIDGLDAGEWIRPVSGREGRGLVAQECRYGRFRGEVCVGDIAQVRLASHCPLPHQPENHLILGDGAWTRISKATWTMLLAAENEFTEAFWRDLGSSRGGIADRVPEQHAESLTCSLQLILVPRLEILVQANLFARNGRAVRARFHYAGREYVLKVTDPLVCSGFNRVTPGTYPMAMAMACVSVTEPFQGFVYRVVASLISPRRLEGKV